MDTEIRYLFLSNRINTFRGHTRNQWQDLRQHSQRMAIFSEDHEAYEAFKGKEAGDLVTYRTNQFKIIELEFE